MSQKSVIHIITEKQNKNRSKIRLKVKLLKTENNLIKSFKK